MSSLWSHISYREGVRIRHHEGWGGEDIDGPVPKAPPAHLHKEGPVPMLRGGQGGIVLQPVPQVGAARLEAGGHEAKGLDAAAPKAEGGTAAKTSLGTPLGSQSPQATTAVPTQAAREGGPAGDERRTAERGEGTKQRGGRGSSPVAIVPGGESKVPPVAPGGRVRRPREGAWDQRRAAFGRQRKPRTGPVACTGYLF
jgi:hypothetical protein